MESLVSDSTSLWDRNSTWDDELQKLLPNLIEFRRTLHRDPHPGFDVASTAQNVREFLETRGLPSPLLTAGGLLYHISSGIGPSLLYRCELDGLPLEEKSAVDWCSESPGKHHGCGHDGHMVMLCGALILLANNPDLWCGEIFALFQPAEETGEGAAAVLIDLDDNHPGILDNLSAVIALHNIPSVSTGQLTLTEPGKTFACASTGLHFHMVGSTSHASQPSLGRNPIPALSRLALEAELLPQIMTQPPYDFPSHDLTLSALVQLNAGRTAFGTCAGEGSLSITIRSLDQAIVDTMRHHLETKAKNEAEAANLQWEMNAVEPFPATVNDKSAVKQFKHALSQSLPAHSPCRNINCLPSPYPWSEDFGHFTNRWPGLLFGLGSGVDQPPLHAPDYDFRDDLVSIGVQLWVSITLGWPTEASP